jgi:hypothetical protein
MPELSELQSTAARWEWVSFISLVIAALAALSEVITTWTTWVRSTWKSRIEKTSLLFVFLGSVVGLVATWKLSTLNGRINAILNDRVATAQKQAGDAMTAAANAQIRLEEQRERTAKVEGAVAEAQAQARKFEAQIASSDARAEEAKRLAEQERLERVKLEAQVAPRRLNVAQQKAITESLKGFNGRTVRLATYALDVDAGMLATQVKPALQQAGILVEDSISNVLPVGGFAVGIHIAGPAAEQDLVKALTESLMRNGKLTAYNRGTKQPAGGSMDKVTVLIGPKPL